MATGSPARTATGRARRTWRRRRHHQDLQSRQGLAKDVDAKCLSCHAGAHPNFERSPHAKAGVSCISCHSIHASKEEALLKASQPTLCFQCHTDVKPQFNMPFHHKVNEGLVKCSDCHDVHGTFGQQRQVHGRSERDLHQVPHRERAGRSCTSMPRSRRRAARGATPARNAERAAAEHAESINHVVQPVPQPGRRRHGSRDERGIGGPPCTAATP
jgi:predicted CXXCH cytochrome family protein